MKRISLLGATGSIGESTLDVVSQHASDYCLEVMTAHTNVEKLIEIAQLHRPRAVAIADESLYGRLKDGLKGTNISVSAGEDALIEAAQRPVDMVVSAIVGAAALKPTLAALKNSTTVALANKECLVCGGDLVTNTAQMNGARLLPVDSEHNAIFQVFDHDRSEGVEKLILTASGGPFRQRPLDTLEDVTPEEAIAHPNWDMGAKISIDSATMMNKGLEVIEAFHLFPVTPDQIDVVIHPQSIIHSMVAYKDSSVLAQLGTPDMRTPIAYALAWPNRITNNVKPLNLAEIGTLTFEEPNERRFPCLTLAKQALKQGGAATLALNAANEVAVEAFRARRIGFLDISRTVGETIERISAIASTPPQSLETVTAMDSEARRLAAEIVLNLS